MHSFSELINWCTGFALSSLEEVNKKTIEAFQTSGATVLVKALQMINLQKTIMAVGMYSLFEAIIQDNLNCRDGFAEAKKILIQHGDTAIIERFTDLGLAVNVLKHGRGRSYDALVARNGGTLQHYVKKPDEDFFNEGDVAEIMTLINVDDEFIHHCGDVIEEVSKIIDTYNP